MAFCAYLLSKNIIADGIMLAIKHLNDYLQQTSLLNNRSISHMIIMKLI